jgi:hypothetical protein
MIFAAGFASACTARADAPLAGKSPFLPPHLQGAAAGTALADGHTAYELRGVMTTPEETLYYIFNVEKKTGDWVALNEAGYAFKLSSPDSAGDSVVLDSTDAGRLVLTLRESKVGALAADEGSSEESPGRIRTGVASNHVATPLEQDRQKRWEKYTEDVIKARRARALALHSGTAGAPQQ